MSLKVVVVVVVLVVVVLVTFDGTFKCMSVLRSTYCTVHTLMKYVLKRTLASV